MFEFVTGGGLGDAPLPPSLFWEAEHIQSALLKDLLAIPGLSITALRDARWPAPAELESAITWKIIAPGEGFQAVWHSTLAENEAVWPIAPESSGLLEQLCHEVESAGKVLLNCPAQAVRLAGSKRDTIERLAQNAVPVVPTCGLKGLRPKFPLIIKPDDGIGCTGLRILRCEEDWNTALCEIDPSLYVVQPLLEGDSLSLSVLFERGESLVLSCNRQTLRRRGDRMQLESVEVNALPVTPAHHQLATAVAEAMPELWGYAGIDLLDLCGTPTVLEINPRLTTSSAGLREALGINLAEAVIKMARQQPWRSGLIRTVNRSVTITWPLT
ncbi:MAG: ATP-grasp domain-containing protein [Methylococcaceae bacterium]